MTLPRALALMSALAVAGLSEAVAQFPPPPGQTSAAQSSPFPPPPGQAAPAQSNPFPPPPGQTQAVQPSPFPPPGQQSSPFPAAPSQASQSPARSSPFPPAGGKSVCEQFPAIRGQAEKDASAIKAASDRKATREEVCGLFNRFSASEAKMVKFLEANRTACGVPPEAIKQVRSQHARTQQIRKNVCSAGSAPRGPSLSDALGGPILPDTTRQKPGRGTFDTLTGNALTR